MKKALFIFLVLATKCTVPNPQEHTEKKYFDITSFAEKLIQYQSQEKVIAVIKSNVNGVEEQAQNSKTDSAFWATELFMLLQSDINKPSLFDAYTVEENVADKNSNLLKVIYTALPTTNSKVKKIEIKYLGTIKNIRQVLIQVESNNAVYATQQTFHVWLNKKEEILLIDSLITSGFNKTIFLDSMVYSSALKVL